MRNDFSRPSRKLSFDDAVEAQMLLMQGWLQSRIAAKLDTNGGRISEINTGKRHPGSKEEALRRLSS